MNIIYSQRNQLSAELEAEFSASYRSMEDLFGESDFISIHVPLNDGTRGMIGKELLEATQPGTIIVNIARADIIQRDIEYMPIEMIQREPCCQQNQQ